MRGSDEQTEALFGFVDLEERVRHGIRGSTRRSGR